MNDETIHPDQRWSKCGRTTSSYEMQLGIHENKEIDARLYCPKCLCEVIVSLAEAIKIRHPELYDEAVKNSDAVRNAARGDKIKNEMD